MSFYEYPHKKLIKSIEFFVEVPPQDESGVEHLGFQVAFMDGSAPIRNYIDPHASVKKDDGTFERVLKDHVYWQTQALHQQIPSIINWRIERGMMTGD